MHGVLCLSDGGTPRRAMPPSGAGMRLLAWSWTWKRFTRSRRSQRHRRCRSLFLPSYAVLRTAKRPVYAVEVHSYVVL